MIEIKSEKRDEHNQGKHPPPVLNNTYRKLCLMRQERAKERRRAPIVKYQLGGELVRYSLLIRRVDTPTGADGQEPIECPEGKANVVPPRRRERWEGERMGGGGKGGSPGIWGCELEALENVVPPRRRERWEGERMGRGGKGRRPGIWGCELEALENQDFSFLLSFTST